MDYRFEFNVKNASIKNVPFYIVIFSNRTKSRTATNRTCNSDFVIKEIKAQWSLQDIFKEIKFAPMHHLKNYIIKQYKTEVHFDSNHIFRLL